MDARSTEDVLHERDEELAVLRQAFEGVVAGRGTVVLLEGAAGIGKTRLLDEACRMAEGRARVLRARGGEQEHGIPLLVTGELFTPYVAAAPEDELDRVFAGAAALAGPVLGRGTADQTVADPGFALMHGLYWLIANLAEECPLVLVVDDMHWVDEASQRWIAYLVPRLTELPVLLLLAVRPRELAPTSPLAGALGGTDVVVLGPERLTAAAAASVVRTVLPRASDEFCVAAHRATGGNPLLLRSLVSSVLHRGLEPDAETARRLDELGAIGLGRIVLPRVHALGAAAVELARVVTVLGDGCSLGDAAEVADLDREVALAAYDALVRAEVLGGGPEAFFSHPLVRAVIADDMPPGATAVLHLRAARSLQAHGADPETVARHVSATDPVREDWVVPVLQAAAASATARGAPEAALRHLVALLREDLDRTTRCLVLLDAGWQAFRCGDLCGRAWLEEALATAPDSGTAVLAWLRVWSWRLILLDGHDPATLTQGIPADLDGDAAYGFASAALLDLGFSGAGLRTLASLPVPDEPPEGRTMFERMFLSALAMDQVVHGGRAELASEYAERAWSDGILLDEAGDFANPAWMLIALQAAGRLGLATRRGHQSLAHATRRGAIAPTEWGVSLTGMAQLFAGDPVAAEATMLTWLEQFELRIPVTMPSWLALLAELHRQRDRLDAAREALGRGGWLDRDPRSDWHGAFLLDRRGAVHLAGGRFAAALEDFERAGHVLDSFGGRRAAFPAWRLGAATALAALGRADDARSLAEEQLSDARTWGAAPLLGASLRTLAVVAGASAEGIEHAEAAVDVLSRSEAAGEHTEALLVLGRLRRVSRDPAGARHVLVEAQDRAVRRGALLLAREVEAELRLTGARPRRRAVTGIHALTPAELRVTTLAAQGLSNPEIAQTLFVTRKTVEKHLGSAFAKLHVSSRDQLSVVLPG